jgi:hypothetical protein
MRVDGKRHEEAALMTPLVAFGQPDFWLITRSEHKPTPPIP